MAEIVDDGVTESGHRRRSVSEETVRGYMGPFHEARGILIGRWGYR